MLEQAKIVGNLEKARRLAFPTFDKIVLEPEAVQILVNLFIHPGCKADINLAKFLTGQPVLLAEISPHIITAFPSTVASYAIKKGITTIRGVDLLECFAIDHTDRVEEHVAMLAMNPSYALAHVLTIGTITSIQHIDIRKLATIEVKVCGQPVLFSHALVPGNIATAIGATVFHHFGVAVATADTPALKKLAHWLQTNQNKKSFLRQTVKQVLGGHIESIDYAKESFFKVDMTGKLIQESKKDFDFQKLWQEEDLKKIKIPKEAKVMFQS
jgi:hypothetical protein